MARPVVIIVEPNPFLRLLYQRGFEREGYAVLDSDDVTGACPSDSDVLVAVVDGGYVDEAVWEKARLAAQRFTRAKIVMLTTSFLCATGGPHAPADACLLKVSDLNELKGVVRGFLPQDTPRREVAVAS